MGIGLRLGIVLVLAGAGFQACAMLAVPTPTGIPAVVFPPTWTPTPRSLFPAVSPGAAGSVTASLPSALACSPAELELYLATVPPLLDQLVAVGRAATQLAALPPERIGPLAQTAAAIRQQLAGLLVPRCLEGSHAAALEAATSLVQGLDSLASGDYSRAEALIRLSFEKLAEATALLAIQMWEATATSTPGS